MIMELIIWKLRSFIGPYSGILSTDTSFKYTENDLVDLDITWQPSSNDRHKIMNDAATVLEDAKNVNERTYGKAKAEHSS